MNIQVPEEQSGPHAVFPKISHSVKMNTLCLFGYPLCNVLDVF